MGETLIKLLGNLLTLLFLAMGVDHLLSNAAIPGWLAVGGALLAGALVGSKTLKEIYENLWDLYYR